MLRLAAVTLLGTAFLWNNGAQAQDRPLTLGLGYQIGPDIWTNADARESVIPIILYRSGNFFIGHSGLGYNIVQRPSYELGVIGNFRTEGFDPGDATGAMAGFEDRDTAFEIGARIALQGQWGQLTGTLATDASDTHEGDAASITYRKPFRFGYLRLVPFVGVNWRDEDLSTYYYGVRSVDVNGNAACAGGTPPAECTLYTAKSESSVEYGVSAVYRMSKNWGVLANLTVETFGDEIENSPVVNDNSGVSFLAGVTYSFVD